MASNREQNEIQYINERIKDLEHYFGKDSDEWIDRKLIIKDKVVDTWRAKSISKYPPYLCPNCNKYWAVALSERHEKKIDYLNKTVFNKIRIERKNCKQCL